MIDIIIPVYNSRLTLSKTLESIVQQKKVPELNIYIIDDSSNEKYDDIIKEFSEKLNINYMLLDDNHGPGYAREFGLENSNGQYIIFLDSDDIFYDEYSVSKLYNAIVVDDYDVVRSVIYAEEDDYYTIYENENIGLHGKIYKRDFIIKNRICFNDTRSNEDTGFNALLKLFGARYNDINDVTYLWCNNPNSITRSNKEIYRDTDLENYAYNMYWAFEVAKKNGIIDEEYILETVIEMYDRYLQASSDETKNKIKKYIADLFTSIESKNIDEKIEQYGIKEIYDANFVDETFGWLKKYVGLKYRAEYEEEAFNDRKYHIDLMNKFNLINPYSDDNYNQLLDEMFGSIGENSQVIPPFYGNLGGKNVYIGSNCYINFCFSVVDDGNIYIGDNVLIGPNVNISTVNHPVNLEERIQNYINVKDVVIKENVWIGSGSIILPGVTIGENSVIGAGSVVTKDIPANVVAVGNPCKIIKDNNELLYL